MPHLRSDRVLGIPLLDHDDDWWTWCGEVIGGQHVTLDPALVDCSACMDRYVGEM
jgi:hypothetical protein